MAAAVEKMRKNDIIEHIYSLIKEYLSSDYSYHGIHHTEDVHRVTQFYINHYGIAGKEAELLEIAAVGHDLGFIETRVDHEIAGARIVEVLMADYGYSSEDSKTVKRLILATNFPQSPQNFLEEILCDADLDYLGRADFDSISLSLRTEWKHFNVLKNGSDFERIQIKFLKSHQYHTLFARKQRNPIKHQHLQDLLSRELYKETASHFGKRRMRISA